MATVKDALKDNSVVDELTDMEETKDIMEQEAPQAEDSSYLLVADNDDPGSLHIGNVPAKEGDQLQVEGETKIRIISFLMGKGDKCHACTKGFGVFPTGPVSYKLIK